jgi:tRNA 2-thiouridine synthesizing protein A
MVELDVSGRSCPIPVLMTKRAIENNPSEEIAVLGDTEVSKENVSRLARSRGYVVTEEWREGGYRLVLRRPE